MEKIGETLDLLLSTSSLEAAVDEIQSLLRSSTAEAIADPSTTRESKKLVLEEKCASFTRLSRMLLEHEDEIKRVVDDLEEEARKIEDELVDLELPDIPPPVLVHFVDVMDQANQYFDFKELAKLSCSDVKPTTSRTGIYHFLLVNPHLFSSFPMIGEHQITLAANDIFWELIHEQRGNKDTKPKDPALLDSIHKLVYKTRVKGYVMDQDPIAQLKKMMKSKPYFYEKHFLSQKLPVECTERAIQAARGKYSQLLRIMSAKYKEASNEKYTVTPTPTSVGNKVGFNEKHEFASTASNANEEGFSEKHKITPTSTFITTGAVDMLPHKRKRDQ